MQYSFARLAVLASGLAASFIGGGDIAHAQMFIRNCSLGCSGGAPGDQIFCSVVEVHENEVLEVEFSLPIDPASLSVNSFRVIDVSNGTAPSGLLRVSPLDPNVLLFGSSEKSAGRSGSWRNWGLGSGAGRLPMQPKKRRERRAGRWRRP